MNHLYSFHLPDYYRRPPILTEKAERAIRPFEWSERPSHPVPVDTSSYGSQVIGAATFDGERPIVRVAFRVGMFDGARAILEEFHVDRASGRRAAESAGVGLILATWHVALHHVALAGSVEAMLWARDADFVTRIGPLLGFRPLSSDDDLRMEIAS